MGRSVGTDRIHVFEMSFKHLLPQSFEDILIYLKTRYGLLRRTPRYISPDERHSSTVISMWRDDRFPNMSRRLSTANDALLKNEFIAGMGAPFDRYEDSQERSEKLKRFVEDCERLSDENFDKLMIYLMPSSISHIRECAGWWWWHSGIFYLMSASEVLIVALVILQQIFKLHILTGEITFFGKHTVSWFDFSVAIGIVMLFGLGVASRSPFRLVKYFLIIVFSPILALARLYQMFFFKVYSLAYETLAEPGHYHLQNPLARTKTLSINLLTSCASLVVICIRPGTSLSRFAIG